MAFPIPAQTFLCASEPGCGWKLTTPDQVGDCRAEGLDAFRNCPGCGGVVRSRNATKREVWRARMQRTWRRPR